MAKRSPILGYNHNVRYRGLVFHVQTEDSGVLSPHLFTHLFHAGVIVSTRKLVYDAGSAEDSIKALMQAQHKAVLKDLRRGIFDEKIDQYLVDVPGLLPRGSNAGEPSPEASQPIAQTTDSAIATEPTPKVDPAVDPAIDDGSSTRRMTAEQIEMEMELAAAGAPVAEAEPAPEGTDEVPESAALPRRAPTIPDVRADLARRVTAERASVPSRIGNVDSDAVAIAIGAASNATIRTVRPEFATPSSDEFDHPDSAPEIEIQLELDEEPEDGAGRSRSTRDTDLALPGALEAVPAGGASPQAASSSISDGVPSLAVAAATIRQVNDSIPPLPAPPSRASTNNVNASALPPVKPLARPQRPAMTPPQVVTRTVTGEDRARRGSDAVEVYAPAPPSAEPPPGLREAERPGQYAQHKRVQREPTQPRAAGSPIPAGLGRPGRAPPPPIPRPAGASNTNPRPRTPTPARASGPSTPRAGSATGGVVMTRPAVIVGAPTKASPPRVRKAREDEGRGFGQGLISEKSLDEVILAYLSEDADEK